MCTIREQHSPNAATNPPKEKWNRKSLGVTNVTVLSFCVGTAQTRPWEPQEHLVDRFAMRSNPSYLEMQINQTMLFLNINGASYQLLFIRLLFSSGVGCACGVMQPSKSTCLLLWDLKVTELEARHVSCPKPVFIMAFYSKPWTVTPFGSIFFHY